MTSGATSSVHGHLGLPEIDHRPSASDPPLPRAPRPRAPAIAPSDPHELLRVAYDAVTEHGRLDVAESAWRQSADEGVPLAMFNLAVLLEERGEDVEAEHWYRRAAERGDDAAMFNLATLLAERGEGAQAEQWYRRAAERGDDAAAARLATLLAERGEGAQDEPATRDRVAAAGPVPAMIGLAMLLARQRNAEHHESETGAGASRPTSALAAALGLLVVVFLVAGAWLATDRPGAAAAAPRLPAAVEGDPSPSSVAAAGPAGTPGLIGEACRDNVAQFVAAVRTTVDPEGNELPATDEAALVSLGHAALARPAVLGYTRLLPPQRGELVHVAARWLCAP